jgi:hypothetical protein
MMKKVQGILAPSGKGLPESGHLRYHHGVDVLSEQWRGPRWRAPNLNGYVERCWTVAMP